MALVLNCYNHIIMDCTEEAPKGLKRSDSEIAENVLAVVEGEKGNRKLIVISGSLVALVTLLSILLTRKNIFSRERDRVE